MEGLPLGERQGMNLEELEATYGYGGSREEVMRVVREIDPSETAPHGVTAVHIAARQVDPEAMEALLERGFRAGATDEYGNTPLHILAVQRWEGRVSKMAECTDLLLSHSCPPSRRDERGRCFYHIAAQMHNLPMISVIGQRGIRCDALLEDSGMNALHVLCDSASSYDYIRENRPEEFEERDRMCRRMAEWLVGCGIDPEAETRIGRKAIDFAVENRIKLTSAFLAGDDDTVSGGMDLHQAVTVDDADAVSAILSAGADPDALCDRPGDYLGMTPLMVACRRMARASAESLIEGGASAAYTDGRDGRTALYHLLRSLSSTVGTGSNARDSGSFLSMLRMVADAQGTPDLPVGDEEGSALCFLAGNDGLGHTSDGRSVRGIAFDTLVSMGADVDARDRHGRTPLILACGIPGPESEGIVSTLMELGADCDASDEDGTTAIMRAASIPGNAGIDLIRAMLDFCVPDLGLRDSMGRDALELASDAGNADVVRLLLSLRGGSPSALGTGRQEHLDDLGEPGLRRIMHRGASVIVGGVGVRPALEEQRDEVVASVAGGQD